MDMQDTHSLGNYVSICVAVPPWLLGASESVLGDHRAREQGQTGQRLCLCIRTAEIEESMGVVSGPLASIVAHRGESRIMSSSHAGSGTDDEVFAWGGARGGRCKGS